MKQMKMYVCTLEEFILSRYLDTLLHKVEDDEHWKSAGLYTLATKD